MNVQTWKPLVLAIVVAAIAGALWRYHWRTDVIVINTPKERQAYNDIRAALDASDAAADRKDPNAAIALATPDYVDLSHGQAHTRDEVGDRLRVLCSTYDTVRFRDTITGFHLVGDDLATVTDSGSVAATMRDPRVNLLLGYTRSSRSDEEWRKTPDGWRLAREWER